MLNSIDSGLLGRFCRLISQLCQAEGLVPLEGLHVGPPQSLQSWYWRRVLVRAFPFAYRAKGCRLRCQVKLPQIDLFEEVTGHKPTLCRVRKLGQMDHLNQLVDLRSAAILIRI